MRTLRITNIEKAGLASALSEAVSVLKAGGLVAYPTESFYAIGADALDAGAVGKVFAAKGRAEMKPLPVIIHDKSLLPRYVRDLSPVAKAAIESLMPGPVTLIFWASDAFPESLTAGAGKVGIRVPEHEIAAGLARLLGGPVTATSANYSGMPGLTDPGAVAVSLGGSLDLMLDAGAAPGPPPSTILDVTVSPPELVREGRVQKAAVEAVLGTLKPL